MNRVKLKDTVDKPILGEWGKEKSESPLGDGIVNLIRTANFLSTGKIDYSNITQRAILKKKKIKEVEVLVVDEKKIETKKLKANDLIIEKSGGGPKTPVGRVVIFEEESDKTFLCSNFLSVLRPKKDLVIPKFLLYQFKYLYQINKVKKYQNQTTGLFNLKLSKYLDVEIDLPSISEQSIIVAQLNKIQELIDTRLKTIDLLDEYIRSIFLEMFGDPVLNDKNWKTVKVHQIGNVITGNTPPRKMKDYYTNNLNGIDWIKNDNIVIDKFYCTPSKERLSTKGLKVARTVPKNSTLIISITGGKNRIGDCSMAKYKLSFNQQINSFVAKNNKIYHYFLFKTSKHLVRTLSKNALKQIVSKTALENLRLIKTDNILQIKFEKIFLKIDPQKQKYQKSLELLETLFQVILQTSFNKEAKIDEEKIFEDILKDFTVDDLKKGNRIQYLINSLNKNKSSESFSSINEYTIAIEKVLALLEDGSIEQYLDNNEIKLKKAL